MIRFTLACDAGHTFESWFPSGSAYDAQVAGGLVTCPVCESPRIAKAPMAPAVARTDRDRPAAKGMEPTADAPPPAPAEASVPMIAEPERQLRALLRAVRAHVVATAEHVGDRFADEARAIHYGESEGRPIYGEASPQEARALAEEGIEVMPLPPAPEDRH